jgi:hypothetical protein
MLSKKLGIDLGTANSIVFVEGEGIAFIEPTVVAIDTNTYTVIAVGTEAKVMIGKTPENIIAKRKLDGTGTAVLIKDIYFQNNADFISNYRVDQMEKENFVCMPFTNSPECTKTIGEINNINVNRGADGVFLNTAQASYWYDLETEKFLMITPYPSKLIAYSPDNKNLLYKDQTGINVFTFEKEDADLNTIIGSNNILSDIKDCSDFNWLFNSRYISYIEGNSLKVIDKKGDNSTALIDTDGYHESIITSTGENIVTLESTTTEDTLTDSFVIKHFSIN